MSITRVQSAGLRSTTTSNTVTLSAGVALGNLLIALVTQGNSTTTITTPTGWTRAIDGTGAGSGVSAYYRIVDSGIVGTTSFTFTLSATANNDLIITEWNSTTGWQTSPLDQTANAISPASTTASSGTTPTTTQASELWVAGLAYAGAAQTETGLTAGWTSGTEAAGGPTLREVYQTTGLVGAASVSFSYATAGNAGGSVATFKPVVVVSPPITSYTILLAGQDITRYVDQMSIVVDDTLGQGAGAGSSGATQGRASTLKFNTSLGPMSTAVGAGQTLPPGGPWLVRQGEVKIYDSTGTLIFGGFATKYTDTSTSILGQTKQNFTTVEGIDYSTSLQRTLVNEVFTGATDVFIIRYILNKYVGWVKLDYLPTTPAYTFATKNFRNQTVEQVIQTVAGITGYMVFVDYNKYIHYLSPTTASSAPFNLSSSPDFVNTFPHAVAEYLVDDNSAINRVFFYGGTKTSNDFWQDISTLANGSNLVFPLAYYPSPMSDGKYHLKINGVDSTVSTSTAAGAGGQFVSQGGTATVLVDPGARNFTFDTGHAPAAGTSLLAGYRYSFPLSLVVADEVSHKYYGDPYLDGSIDDNTIFDLATGIQRCRVLLAQQNYGLTTLKVDLYNKPGVQAGMVINIFNQLRGINGTYLVQEVQTEPYGGGNFVYHLSLGSWNWNLIDFLMKLPTLATFQDDTTESQEIVTVEQLVSGVQVHDVWSTRTSTAPYYARAAAVGDGHDAYPGFSTAA